MDFNVYAAERLAEARLADLRGHRARIALLGAAGRPRHRVLRSLGTALIRVGHWLARRDAVGARNAGVRVAPLR
jgi:hypothetical protein